MKKSKRLWRTLLFFVLLAALCGSFAIPMIDMPVRAAPQMQGPLVCNLTMAQWAFDPTPTSTSAPVPSTATVVASSSSSGLQGLSFTGAGAVSGNAWTADHWSTGGIDLTKFFEFDVNTTGYSGIALTFVVSRSSSGPATISVQYSTDGTNYTELQTNSVSITPTLTTVTANFSSVPILDNNANAKFRIHGYGASGVTGSMHLDNVTFAGCQPATPTSTPTDTGTPTNTGTPTDTATATGTATSTATATNTGTAAAALSVLINEVAWSGTAANSSDEWIELYNPSSIPVDITGWHLYGDDNVLNKVGSPNITLSGTIPAGGYFLLERDEQATDVPSDQVYSSGDLLNTGERLYLKDKAGNTIDTANLDGGAWPAGTASTTTTSPPAYASMERVGTAGNQWVTYQGTIVEAHNRNGGDIKGTPGSANWIKTASVTTITSDLPDPSVVNQNVTVKVTVVGGTSTPTGTVNITGANTNCTLTLVSGTGICTVKFTSVGSKTLTAIYHSTSGLPVSSDTESHQVVTSGTIYRTPTPIPPPPPQLIAINEFVPRPGHDWNHDGVVNVGDEYIELLNHGTVDVNLSGWRLDDEVNIGSNPYSLPSKVLKPGERIVFFGSQTGLLLGDGGDAVRLLKPNGQLIDAYNYSVVRYPDESYCRLPDNGGADDWNQNCFPTPGLQNSLSGNIVPPSTGVIEEQPACPISDTLPEDFVQAECDPFGDNIWRPEFWDRTGWYDEKDLPSIDGKWPVFAD